MEDKPKSIEHLNYILRKLCIANWDIVSDILKDMPDAEYEKIPIILMRKADKEVIETYGIVDVPYRNGDYENQERVYSCGSTIFRIKTK